MKNMRKFAKQALRIADTLSNESFHLLVGPEADIQEFLADLLEESVCQEKQIEALTAERQMDIMLSPDSERRHRVVKLLEAVENVKLHEWPLILPLWMVVSLIEGFTLCESLYYIRSGFVRVSGERQWSADKLKKHNKTVKRSFIDKEEEEIIQDGDEALKFKFSNTITNPDSLMLCRRKARIVGGCFVVVEEDSFETLDKVEMLWAGSDATENEDIEDLKHLRPANVPDSHPTEKNSAGFLEVEQVHPDSKLLSWLFDRSNLDNTICWPMVYFDLRPFFDPVTMRHICKEETS